MADLNAALVQQLLHVPVAAKRRQRPGVLMGAAQVKKRRCSGQEAQKEAMVQPNCVPNDGHWEAVAVGFRVSHSGSAYPNPIKATQPLDGPLEGGAVALLVKEGMLTCNAVEVSIPSLSHTGGARHERERVAPLILPSARGPAWSALHGILEQRLLTLAPRRDTARA